MLKDDTHMNHGPSTRESRGGPRRPEIPQDETLAERRDHRDSEQKELVGALNQMTIKILEAKLQVNAAKFGPMATCAKTVIGKTYWTTHIDKIGNMHPKWQEVFESISFRLYL